MTFKHIAQALAGPAITGALGLRLGSANAQDYPNKPIRIIAPFPAGSGPDVNAREMAGKLTPLLEKTVIVEIRPGAASAVGTEVAARAAARKVSAPLSTAPAEFAAFLKTDQAR